MQEKKCSHVWEMANVCYGFVITEQCSNSNKVVTYFDTAEPPIEEYRDGENFWNVMETAQAIRFDLKCTQCGHEEKLDNCMGLMMCIGCHDDCEANVLMKKLEPERTWVYVAFGFLPAEENKRLSREQLNALEEYFNQRRKSATSRIKIVGDDMVKSYATCKGEVLRDLDLLSLTPPEEK